MKTHPLSLQPKSDKTCVLYSADSGKIVFTHRFTVLGEGPELSTAEVEKQTRAGFESHLQQVDRANMPQGRLEALIVSSDEFKPGHRFSVDQERRSLIAEPRQPSKS